MVSGGGCKSLAAVGHQNATVWRPKAARAAAKCRGAEAGYVSLTHCARVPWAQSTILYIHNKLDRTQTALTYGASSNHYGASFRIRRMLNLCSLTVLWVITHKPRAERARFLCGQNVRRWEISLNRENFPPKNAHEN